MGDRPDHLTVGEFQRSMQALERAVTTGFARTDDRLERIESVLTHHGERIAVLESASKTRSRKAAGWSTAAAAFVVTVFEGVRAYLR
jgi:hypothetical protein